MRYHIACLQPNQPPILGGLRIYPTPFARHLVDLLEDMKASAKGCPELPALVPHARETLANWPATNRKDWEFSALAEVYQYLRGNRNLKIPTEWRGIVPDRLG